MLSKWKSNRRIQEPWQNVIAVAAMVVCALFLLDVFIQRCSSTEARAEAAVSLTASESEYVEPWDSEDWVDPMGQSVMPKETSGFPNRSQLQLIGRLASGIANWKRGQGGWWYCGEWVDDDPKLTDLAMLLAYNLVRAAVRFSGNDYLINIWGMAGTVANESRFDACALGSKPRKWAYKEGIIEPRKKCISHTKDEILRVVTNTEAQNAFSRSGFDLGLCQILTRFYPETPFSEFMSATIGMDVCAQEMQRRSWRYNTYRPWLYWRGSATPWYDVKIKRWARRLGARATEI